MSNFFGLDIGTYSIKILKASKKADEYKLEAYAQVKTPELVKNDDNSERAMAEAIKKCFQEAKPKTKDANVCLEESQVYSQVVKFPVLSAKELDNAIRFEAEQFIPVPLDEVQLEYQVLRQPPKGSMVEKTEVLVIAAQKKAVEQRLRVLKLAGIHPVSLETEMLANVRLFNKEQENILFLSLGQESSNIALFDKGKLKFVHALSASGNALTRSLASQLSMSFEQAEQYKEAYGLDFNLLEGKVAQVLQAIIDALCLEIDKTIAYISKNYPAFVIKRLLLSGGTANLKGLSSYLAKKLNLEIDIADPFSSFNKEDVLPKEIMQAKCSFVTVVGLAIKDI